jgi:hypothetical protein
MPGTKKALFGNIAATAKTNVDPYFEVVDVSLQGQPQQFATLTPVSLLGTSQDPEVGLVTWELDRSRVSSLTEVRGDVPGKEYPATVSIRLYTTARVQSRPGVVYSSTDEVRLRATNVAHFNPFNADAKFELEAPVVFVNPENAADAFTLEAVTLSGELGS